jgi:diadenosine tetraphosphate (Ap4A) HIT family hydrolase
MYDDGNVFAKILRGEIPCNKVYEDEHVLAFRDIQPQTRVHVLVIPKMWRCKIAKDLGVEDDGYRILANTGRNGHQEVPHFHLHIFGGQPLGRMIRPPQG